MAAAYMSEHAVASGLRLPSGKVRMLRGQFDAAARAAISPLGARFAQLPISEIFLFALFGPPFPNCNGAGLRGINRPRCPVLLSRRADTSA